MQNVMLVYALAPYSLRGTQQSAVALTRRQCAAPTGTRSDVVMMYKSNLY
jgi:hypothetical protein